MTKPSADPVVAPDSSPAPRRHIFAWVLVFVVLAAMLYAMRVRTEMADFEVYRTAASRAVEAEPLYRAEDEHFQFKYLPAFAIAMIPFAWMPAETAKAAWYAVSVVLLWVFVAWSIRALPGRRRTTAALTWITILLMGKFYAHELNLGQTNLLLGVVLVGALMAAARGQSSLAGALVGVGIFVKPYAAILLLWLPCNAGLAGLVTAGVALGVGLALPAVVYGWQGNLDLLLAWYRTVTESTAPNLLGADNISLAATWAKWMGVGALATRLAGATAVSVLAIVGWATWRRRPVANAGYLEFGMLMLLVPLISPQGWDYVLLLGTPAIVCLADRFEVMTAPWRIVTALAAVFMSFTIFDLLGRALYSRLMAVNIVSVCAVVLFVSLAHLRRRALA